MSLPNPGNSISLSQINTELGRASNAQISLNTAEDNGYVAINGCSQYRPRAANPAKMSEWYRYNHNATCFYCYNGSNAITQAFTVSNNNYFNATYYYFPIAFTSVGESYITAILSGVTGGNINFDAGFAYYYPSYNNYLEDWLTATAGTNVSSGTFISDGNGIVPESLTSTDGVRYLFLRVYTAAPNTTVSGTFELRFSCPTITTCGNTYNTYTYDCQYNVWHWMDAGTSSRTITLTYSIGSAWIHGGAQIYIKDENDNVVVNGASITVGSNQTYSFSFTYQGYRYIKIMFYDPTAC